MKRISILLLLFLAFSQELVGQEIVKTQDLGLWLSGEFSKQFKEDYSFSASQEVRLYESITELDKSITQLSIDYKINKKFKISGGIRYAFNAKEDKTISQDFRYHGDFGYKLKFNKDFSMKYRLRFQTRYPNLFLPTRKGSDSDFRHRHSFDFDLNKKHELGFSAEIWREFELYEKPHFGKIRLLPSDEMEWNKQKINVFGGFEKDIDESTPMTYYIVGIAYKFESK